MTVRLICGIDEAGRGPLAGPVTAACACLPEGYINSEITDSKKLSDKKRRKLLQEIQEVSLAYAIVSVGPRRIEQLNILQATRFAMKLCAERVEKKLKQIFPDRETLFLIDGNAKIETTLTQQTIIKGDSTVLAISAASILAKVTRDDLMDKLNERYPFYQFSKHKGYGTLSHRQAIINYGVSPVHRKTFAGVSEFIKVPLQEDLTPVTIEIS